MEGNLTRCEGATGFTRPVKAVRCLQVRAFHPIRRRLIPALLLLSLACLFLLPAPGAHAEARLVRVGIGRALLTARIGVTGPGQLQGADGKVVWQAAAAASVDVSRTANGIAVAGAAVTGPLTLTAAPGGYVTLGTARYRGSLQVLRTAAGALSVVNVLAMEDYLLGVVPREMPSYWPAEALKAQAVAARTYALYEMSGPRFADEGFDVTADTSSQVYGGLEAEAPGSSAAVQATAGQTLTYGGAVIPAFFFSSSGGATESDVYVMGGQGHPYLQGVLDYDQASPNYRWVVSLTSAEVSEKLRQAGHDVGTVTAMTGTTVPGVPEDRYRSPSTGQYKEYTVTGSSGIATLTTGLLRKAFDLKSRVWEVVVKGARWVAQTVGLQQTDTVWVQGADAGAVIPRTVAGSYVVGAGSKPAPVGGSVAAMGILSVPATIEFQGRGWGHGVGLSQWGARGMAQQGKSYQEILAHYYTGTQLVTR